MHKVRNIWKAPRYTQMTQAQGNRQECARMQGVKSQAMAMGNLSVIPGTEFWTLDSRFKGSSAWGEEKAAFEQFVAPSRQRVVLQVFTISFMTSLLYH